MGSHPAKERIPHSNYPVKYVVREGKQVKDNMAFLQAPDRSDAQAAGKTSLEDSGALVRRSRSPMMPQRRSDKV
jgi:hypothetical protein